MKPFLNILIGINYTDASNRALAKAHKIAAKEGAKITACHVVALGEISEFVNFYMIEHKIMMNAALSSLEDFVETSLGKDHDVTCQIGEGIPHHELISKANEEGYDLLVLGDDDSAEDSRKAGQFAIKCLRFATLPVLLVNQPEGDSRGSIAACIDFSKATAPVLENAARLALGKSPDLHLVHSCRPPWLRPRRLRYQKNVSANRDLKEQYREILAGRFLEVRQLAATFFNGNIESFPIESEDPTEALLNHLDTTDCSLVVIGRSGKGLKGLISDFLGGTAEEIIRHAGCPVLIVPVTN
jgi:nucleotide-binding universal stress UspA family protein